MAFQVVGNDTQLKSSFGLVDDSFHLVTEALDWFQPQSKTHPMIEACWWRIRQARQIEKVV